MKNNYKIAAFIPSRYASTRLPAKPLADISGKSLIQRVWEGVSTSKIIDSIFIPTDDQRIYDHCLSFGSVPIMTGEAASGSDRILLALNELHSNYDYIINIQGDEPLVNAQLLDDFIPAFINSGFDVGTIIRKIETSDELFEPSVVKTVLGKNCKAVYFSRSPVPYLREAEKEKWVEVHQYFAHIGIYFYKLSALTEFGKLPRSVNEKAESLEQLRFLDNNFSIFCYETNQKLIGVDTPQDLEKVRSLFS